MSWIESETVINAINENIKKCNKALSSFSISGEDAYAVKVEKASMVNLKEQIEALSEIDVPVINVGDTISRQAAIDVLYTCRDTRTIDTTDGGTYIDFEQAEELMEQLPDPKRTGHWEIGIYRSVDHHTGTTYRDGEALICSACRNGFKKAFVDARWKFCPACGAKMEEVDG